MEKQRYLSYQEYADRGYVLRNDVQFATGSYSSYSLDLNPFDLAYRADTKEQYYWDASKGIGEIALAYVTGGTSRMVRTTYGVLVDMLSND